MSSILGRYVAWREYDQRSSRYVDMVGRARDCTYVLNGHTCGFRLLVELPTGDLVEVLARTTKTVGDRDAARLTKNVLRRKQPCLSGSHPRNE